MTLCMHFLIEVWQLEDGQVIVPELDRGIEHEPALADLKASLDRRNDMVNKSLLLLDEFLFLLRSKLTLVLVLFDCHELVMADFNLFLKQEFNLHLS